jgi:hypothetical protein
MAVSKDKETKRFHCEKQIGSANSDKKGNARNEEEQEARRLFF